MIPAVHEPYARPLDTHSRHAANVPSQSQCISFQQGVLRAEGVDKQFQRVERDGRGDQAPVVLCHSWKKNWMMECMTDEQRIDVPV